MPSKQVELQDEICEILTEEWGEDNRQCFDDAINRLDNLFKEELHRATTEAETRVKDKVNEAIAAVCADEEVHCDFSCHTCGGVKEFLIKFRAELTNSLEQET